jgi:3-oxoacyl-[acyl-carrier-protein] synthase-3
VIGMLAEPIGITALACHVGEQVITAEELARTLGAEPATVEKWLGGLAIHASALSECELGAEAAKKCLAKAGVDAKDVQAVVWGSTTPYAPEQGRRELHVQHLIGATAATAIELGMPCSESITGLRLAAALLAADRSMERVLVVFGEKREGARTLGFDVSTYQPVFSDAGAAALVTRTNTRRLLAFGEASDGKYWDFLHKVRTRPAEAPRPTGAEGKLPIDPERARLAVDSARLHKRALEQCLAAGGATRADVHRVLLTREGPRIPHAIMRQLDLPSEKLYAPAHGPTHVGMGDYLLHLEAMLAESPPEPGALLLLGSRAVGTVRFCLVRA